MKPSLNHLNLSSLNFKVLYRYFATYCHRASHYVVNHNGMSHIHSHPHSSPLLHKIQLGPIYEGLLNFMVEPIRPIVRPHNYQHLRCGRADRDGCFQCWQARTPLPHHFNAVWGQRSSYQRATGRLLLGRGAATSLSTEFRARNHAALEHIDIVVGYDRSGVLLSSTRLRQ